MLLQYLRGRHIVLSSGAEGWAQARGPHEACAVGRALGLDRDQVNALPTYPDNRVFPASPPAYFVYVSMPTTVSCICRRCVP